ncbi:hypothetical protein H0H92_007106 [Tricholoma furcatifolium]|nr:hypothetical protein H0H92_007106 [Tricholoma furcatifolium]
MHSQYHYIRIALTPPSTYRDALTIRKTLQDALTQTFGVTSAGLHVDILWVAEDSSDDASKILAAIVAWSDAPSLRVVRESPFLPSLAVSDDPL